MGKSIYRFSHNYAGCELSVQKDFFVLHIKKQLYIPSKPLLARFSGYVAETQCYQGFYLIIKNIFS